MAKDDDNLDLAWGELLVIGSRYHRNLHQDEFGPTRAERMQALRDLLDRLEVLSSRLEALPPQLRLLVSERRTEGRSAAGPTWSRRHPGKRPAHGGARKPAQHQALRPHRRRDYAR